MTKKLADVGNTVWCLDAFGRVTSGKVDRQTTSNAKTERLSVLTRGGVTIWRLRAQLFASAAKANAYAAGQVVKEARRTLVRYNTTATEAGRLAVVVGKRLAKAEARLAALRAKAGK